MAEKKSFLANYFNKFTRKNPYNMIISSSFGLRRLYLFIFKVEGSKYISKFEIRMSFNLTFKFKD